MSKKTIQFVSYSAALLIGLVALNEIANWGIKPLWIFLGAIALLYLVIALAKFPAAFFVLLLFISRDTDLPAAPFGSIGEVKALPVCTVLLVIALCFRLVQLAATRQPWSLRDAFDNQGKGVLAFVFFAILVAVSYSYTPSPLYGSTKLVSFLVVGGLMFFGPFILLRDESDFRHFAYSTVIMALASSALRLRADSRGLFSQHEPVTHIGAGQLIGMAIILLLNYRFVQNRYARLLIIPCLLCLAMGLIASEVRGALLAVGIVLLGSLFTHRRKMSLISPRTATLGLAVILGALFIVPGHWFQGGAARMFQAKTEEITQFMDQGSYSWKGSGGQRLIFFGAAVDGIAEKPLLGWGVGGWSYYFWHSDIWEYPHNVFLEVGVEQGLIGLAAYLIFLAFAFRAAKKCFDEPSGRFAFVLPMLVYIVLLTCSTGDIDDCRFIWFTCSVAFVASRLIEQQPEQTFVERLRRPKMRIGLQFSPEQAAAHRCRVGYAFRVFCAIYGHTPLLGNEEAASSELLIRYGSKTAPSARPVLQLSNLYTPRPLAEPAPAPNKYVRDNQHTVLFYQPAPGQQPDWLGEIFEWLSCADEYAVKERDKWQRVPFSANYVGRHHLDGRVPYAAVAMSILNATICRLLGKKPTAPQSPVSSVSHFVVPTHDIDYLPISRFNGVHRVAKNAAISLLASKRPGLAIRQAGMALRLTLGSHDPMDQLSALVRAERNRGISASYYFLPRRLHSKDANYSLESRGVIDILRSLEAAGMEIGVHGTYTCLESRDGLRREYKLFQTDGFHPQGGRQHWLRFTLDNLIRGLELAGAAYDTSHGWADRVGYRAGACFAFPPYNFDQERAANFLEIPMAIMDVALRDQGTREHDWYDEAMSVLSASRRFGWGGISLLWHPMAFGGAWLSPEAGRVFWRLLDQSSKHNEVWMSAADFLEAARQRYVDAGLWPAARHCAEAETQSQLMEETRVARIG